MSTYQCSCGGTWFYITVTQLASIQFLENDDHYVEDIRGDAEWDDDTDAICPACHWSGKLGEIKKETT